MGSKRSVNKMGRSSHVAPTAHRLADEVSHLPVFVMGEGNRVRTVCKRCPWVSHTVDAAVVVRHVASH